MLETKPKTTLLWYIPLVDVDHSNYTFHIEDVSRALLQELARHRHASLSVKSSRYTTKRELKLEKSFLS